MGRALEPGGRFPVVLDWDMDKPEERRPTIYTVALSMRKQEWLGELLDNAPQGSTKEFFDTLAKGLAEVIVDWANFFDPKTGEPIVYSCDAIKDVFTFGEAREIFRKVLASGSASKADEKKSG
jgi:hypothetical protein